MSLHSCWTFSSTKVSSTVETTRKQNVAGVYDHGVTRCKLAVNITHRYKHCKDKYIYIRFPSIFSSAKNILSIPKFSPSLHITPVNFHSWPISTLFYEENCNSGVSFEILPEGQ